MGVAQSAADFGDESGATHGDSATAASSDDAERLQAGAERDESDDTLALSISPKRALVSLAFLGASLARRRRRLSV